MANRRKGQGDPRGSSADRQRRKVKLLYWHGDGVTCPCVHCGIELNSATLQQDRIIPGGSYRMSNVQPSCGPCNLARGDSPITPYRKAA